LQLFEYVSVENQKVKVEMNLSKPI